MTRLVGIRTRAAAWVEDRSGLVSAAGRLLRHPVPPRTGWRYVLGSATLVAFAIQVVTGTVLATVYAPSAAGAYPSLQWITHAAAFGRVLRGLHYFGASAMVVLVAAHMARVFLTASYKYPRELGWLTGVALLFATLAMAFTGQILRWDQDAIWSAVVAAEQAARVPLVGPWLVHLILGGHTLGAPTLTRAFATHVFAFPAAIVALVGVHLWLVLRNGISEPPEISAPAEPGAGRASYRAWYRDLLARDGRPFWPDVAWRDAAFAAAVVAVVLGLALALGPAPLGAPPDPTRVDASPRPDWYFLWYFAVLAKLPRQVETPVMVLGPLAAVAVLLALPFVGGRGSRHLRARPWAPVVVGVAVAGVAWLTVLGDQAPWSPRFAARPVAAAAGAAPRAAEGARLFHDRGCEYCHAVGGEGGIRGPDLTHVADRLNHAQLVSRILGGAGNMPAYAGNLAPGELDAIIAYLTARGQPTGREPARTASR